jgi:hypothetical protein
VAGQALLVGAILPLDLRLLGLWRGVDLDGLARVLRPVAAAGLALAAASGFLLFAVAARDYWATALFQVKLAMVAAAMLNAALLGAGRLSALSPDRRRLAGGLSLVLWPAALVCGRLIGYL